jgi:hypothetical protein
VPAQHEHARTVGTPADCAVVQLLSPTTLDRAQIDGEPLQHGC